MLKFNNKFPNKSLALSLTLLSMTSLANAAEIAKSKFNITLTQANLALGLATQNSRPKPVVNINARLHVKSQKLVDVKVVETAFAERIVYFAAGCTRGPCSRVDVDSIAKKMFSNAYEKFFKDLQGKPMDTSLRAMFMWQYYLSNEQKRTSQETGVDIMVGELKNELINRPESYHPEAYSAALKINIHERFDFSKPNPSLTAGLINAKVMIVQEAVKQEMKEVVLTDEEVIDLLKRKDSDLGAQIKIKANLACATNQFNELKILHPTQKETTLNNSPNAQLPLTLLKHQIVLRKISEANRLAQVPGVMIECGGAEIRILK